MDITISRLDRYVHTSLLSFHPIQQLLEWNLDVPFTSLDKPPAIAMVVTMSKERSLRRYRLVVAQKSRLRLVPEVLATFASHGRDHRLTASGVFPCLLIGNTCMVMLRMDTARPFGCALPIMETPCLFIYNEAPKCSSMEHFRTESSL